MEVVVIGGGEFMVGSLMEVEENGERERENIVQWDHDKISNLMVKTSFPIMGKDSPFPC